MLLGDKHGGVAFTRFPGQASEAANQFDSTYFYSMALICEEVL